MQELNQKTIESVSGGDCWCYCDFASSPMGPDQPCKSGTKYIGKKSNIDECRSGCDSQGMSLYDCTQSRLGGGWRCAIL